MSDSPSDLLKRFPASRRFLPGFHGTTLPHFLREQLAQGLAGVTLYPRNFESVVDLITLTSEIRAAAAGPVLIGIDQEGGSQFSLPSPFTQWPSPAEFGTLGDTSLVRSAAEAMGRELSAAGCNLDFAPMLDLHVNPASPVTKRRSFGAEPELVAKMGIAFHDGLACAGVLGCAKHFPGHGDAEVDPHEDLPIFRGDLARLCTMELVPFAALVAAGIPTIMTAHILLPEIDADDPASISPRLLRDELRGRMKFQGIIFADDLGMGAIKRRYALSEAVVKTFAAGTDIAMLCHDLSKLPPAIDAANAALDSGRLSAAEWEASGTRIQNLLARVAEVPEQDLAVIGCAHHQALAAEIAHRVGALSRVAS